MDNKTAKELIDKYLAGQCTPEEEALVETWYNQLSDKQEAMPGQPDYEARNRQISAGLPPDPTTPAIRRLWPRIAAAASIIICIGIGLFFLTQPNLQKLKVQIAKNDIISENNKSENNKAVLTLANGQRIVLTGARNGRLAAEGGTAITKTMDGQISYNAQAASSAGAAAFNTISTPRGGQYQVVLPDGSHVWLNAASSIRFSAAFTGNDREVQITGEAYFEVAHNKAKPFRVRSNGQTVEVVGTHFNVSAYSDEKCIYTTLLEGSVKVRSKTKTAIIRPGQVAINNLNDEITVKQADIDEAMAWKNGMFMFNNEDIASIMRKVSRWYDVDIDYKGDISNIYIDGNYSRSKSLKSLLRNIELMDNVKFKINERRVTIIAK